MDVAINYATIVARAQGRNRSRGRRLAKGVIAAIVIGCVLFVLAALFCCWFCCCRKKRSKKTIEHQPATGGGFMSRFRGNRHHQPHPGMQEAGYGAPPPQHPHPTYR